MKPARIAILIINYKNQPLTQACIDSLCKQLDQNFQIYLLDNQTQTKLHITFKGRYPLKLFQSQSNLGFAGGNNLLLQKAIKSNHQFIMLLNNDTEAHPDLTNKLQTFLSFNSQIEVVSPIITYYHQENTIWFGGGQWNKLLAYTRHLYMNKNIHKLADSDPYPVDWLSGCCVMARSSVFQKVGLFNPDFFAYYEDVDWSLRAKQQNFQLFILPQPLVKHKVSSSFGASGSNTLSPLRAYYYARNVFPIISRQPIHVIPIQILGQFCLRLPYFFLIMVIQGQLHSILSYFRGLVHGLAYLYRHRNSPTS